MIFDSALIFHSLLPFNRAVGVASEVPSVFCIWCAVDKHCALKQSCDLAVNVTDQLSLLLQSFNSLAHTQKEMQSAR